MDQIEALLTVATVFGQARQIGEARVSTLVFNDGKRLQRIRDGADIGSRSIDKALSWLSENWPADATWPSRVKRPVSEQAEVAA